MVNPIIFQIVGFQNSGKTTFMKRLLQNLRKRELTAVTMKHHGHGGKPSIPEDKDSYQHVQAGAIASLVEGEGRLILHAEKEEWSLIEKLSIASHFHSDLILIEGHKDENFSKAVLIRRYEDIESLSKLQNIQVVFYWDKSLIGKEESLKGFPQFDINDSNGYVWLVDWFLKEIVKSNNHLERLC